MGGEGENEKGNVAHHAPKVEDKGGRGTRSREIRRGKTTFRWRQGRKVKGRDGRRTERKGKETKKENVREEVK